MKYFLLPINYWNSIRKMVNILKKTNTFCVLSVKHRITSVSQSFWHGKWFLFSFHQFKTTFKFNKNKIQVVSVVEKMCFHTRTPPMYCGWKDKSHLHMIMSMRCVFTRNSTHTLSYWNQVLSEFLSRKMEKFVENVAQSMPHRFRNCNEMSLWACCSDSELPSASSRWSSWPEEQKLKWLYWELHVNQVKN